MHIQLLPDEEWNFHDLDDKEVKLAFYYEYGRSSDEIKKVVDKMRVARPHPRIWPYCPREHHLFEVLLWLAEQEPCFPETSWLAVKASAIAKIQKQRTEARRQEAQINAKLPAGQKFCVGGRAGNPGDPVEPIEWMVEAKFNRVDLRFSAAGFQHVWRGDSKAVCAWYENAAKHFSIISTGELMPSPEHGSVHGAVDWRATDSEIIEQFKWFLERERPRQFKKNAKTPTLQRGYDITLPVSKAAALRWLGVLRKRKSVKSWREYVETYDTKNLDAPKKPILKSRDVTALTRQHQRDCRKAELILDWFNNGKKLNKEDFK